MKHLLLHFLFLLGSLPALAQAPTEQSMFGTWKVIHSQITTMPSDIDAKGKQTLEMLRKGFINTTFTLHANKQFNVRFPSTFPSSMKEMEMLNNQKWRLVNNLIEIGKEEDGYTIATIEVVKKQGKTFFIFEEAPFLLEVVKQ